MWLLRYAVFFLLRDVGSLTDDFSTFVSKLGAAGSPAYQLKLVNSYRLPEASHPAAPGTSKALHDGQDDSCGPIVGDQRDSCMHPRGMLRVCSCNVSRSLNMAMT